MPLSRSTALKKHRLRRADKLLGESDVVMVKDFAAEHTHARDALRLLGYRSVDTEPDMVLTLKPPGRNTTTTSPASPPATAATPRS